MPDSLPAQAGALITGLEWIYGRVARGLAPGTGLATDAEIDRWIALASAGAGTAGFVTNLGGAITLPVAVPANLLGTAAIQLALVARTAPARGHDPAASGTPTVAITCLLGGKATEVLSAAGVKLGTRLAQSAVNQVAGATLARINAAVGFRLLTKAGQGGVVNLTRLVPVAGGIVAGTVDAAGTFAVGKAAKQLFPRVPAPVPLTPEGAAMAAPLPLLPSPPAGDA